MTMAAVRRSRAAVPALLLALALPAALTACSSSGKPAAGSTSTAGTSRSSPAGAGTTVTVTEKEFSLTLSQNAFAPGTYTFVADNTGAVTHALAVAGPGVAAVQTAGIPPGGKAQVTVTLQQGSYELWCPIDGHKALGMDTHIQVGGAGSSPPDTGRPTASSNPSAAGGY